MYRKNTAGQFICVQLILTATGAVGTGLTPAARRCLDGTFAAATGTFTEDGTTGSYKFALSQADTNANNVSIIVTGTGAIPVCVNFVTTAADPTDGVRLGLTALPNAAAEAAGGLYTRGAGAGQIAQQANGQVDTNLSTIKTQAVTCAGGVTVPAATLASTANIITAALGATERTAIADAMLDETNGVETSWTVRMVLRIVFAVLGGKASGMGTATGVFRSGTDSKDRVTATQDASGNRTAVTLDGT